MFAPEGYLLIAGAVFVAAVLTLAGYLVGGVWLYIAVLLALLVVGFTLYFFRDPERTPPEAASKGDLLLAPADGKIVEIVEEEEPRFLKETARRISIFLSPLNVHVNRVPADGEIKYVNYVPGDYLVAWHPKASEKNERSELGLLHGNGDRVLFKQIAGAMARRIVYHLEEGQAVKAGERFGVVKFGSRMDIHVPMHVEIDAEIGQRVVAGQTILGKFVSSTVHSEGHREDESIAARR